MGLKTHKPTTPSRRHMVLSDFSDITKSTPERSLVKAKKSKAQIEAEDEEERQARQAEMEADKDPAIKAAQDKAIKAREERRTHLRASPRRRTQTALPGDRFQTR